MRFLRIRTKRHELIITPGALPLSRSRTRLRRLCALWIAADLHAPSSQMTSTSWCVFAVSRELEAARRADSLPAGRRPGPAALSRCGALYPVVHTLSLFFPPRTTAIQPFLLSRTSSEHERGVFLLEACKQDLQTRLLVLGRRRDVALAGVRVAAGLAPSRAVDLERNRERHLQRERESVSHDLVNSP